MVPEPLNGVSGGGHGIAFIISPSTPFKGALATEFLGLFNASTIGLPSNHLLAIELDTVKNLEFGDINDNHVGVDVNNLTSIESAPASYLLPNEAKNKILALNCGDPIQVWIDYNQMEKLVNVTLAPLPIKKPEKPLLSTRIDLSSVFLDSMYVGFSASTGSNYASHHYILGWSFNDSGQAQSLDLSKLPKLPPTIFAMRKKRYGEVLEDWEQQYGPQRISYKDLYKATKGFNDKELLGCGGFGKVYKGVLPSNNVQVAVKKVSHDSKQGIKEFVAEIASTGRLRHRNLVRLLGYCRRKGELFLVYDYMPNGSLDKFLFSNGKQNLDWIHRYQIIKDVAYALLYLHEEWEQVVLHRDVKASNVLLDSELNGRLGDFGLSKFYDHGSNPQTTCVVGTVGYLAPELIRTGKPTTSSDVFAFGNFMLEVAYGRRPVEQERQENVVVLIDWVLSCWKREVILESVDPRLGSNYVVEEMELVLKLGLVCTHRSPAARPTLRQVLQYLDGNAKSPDISLVSGSYIACTDSITFVASTNDGASYSLSDINSVLINGR
ncbi:hypothetical protein JCGZ_20940 [Jatropha curcas]|uniref:non-specific serine/threonine protein kinase n=1 Tax=Jatropha curcas TaxID=180498 RepID=A0A067K4Z2_JATCU|nr:hypothetical protein JCGZ_20940 [Jatropha curcas]